MTKSVEEYYNSQYAKANYFGYSEWMYSPYVKSLVSLAGLRRNARLLDVGCGQGFFSHLFQKHGMNVHGIDISETGIEEAKRRYGHHGIKFEALDINAAQFTEPFDCVFVRSCSLYNNEGFAGAGAITDTLLSLLKPDGVCIFAHNSKFSGKKSITCAYHRLEDVRNHFGGFPGLQVFFSTRADALLLGRRSYSPVITRINIWLSRVLSIGGDVVVVLRPQAGRQATGTGNLSSARRAGA